MSNYVGYYMLCVLLLSMGGLHSVVKADIHGDSIIQDADLRQDMNLSDFIWNATLDLLPKAWNTTFIAGVADGSMDPDFYGDYILQDAIYCRVVAQLWTRLANNASVDIAVRNFAYNSSSGFQDCANTLFDQWSVIDDRNDGYGVIMREPVRAYVTFIEDTMLNHPPNMLIATYACLKLWNNLLGELYPRLVNSTNPYRFWVIANYGSGSSMRRQANQMDLWDQQLQWYDWSEASSLFRTAMMNEINFFDNAGSGKTACSKLDTKHVFKA